MINEILENVLNRKFSDAILTGDMTIGDFGGQSATLEIFPKNRNVGAIITPFFMAYDANGAILKTVDTRHPINVVMLSDKTQYPIIPDPMEIFLLNEYYSMQNAKPILIDVQDKLLITASQDDSVGYGAEVDFTPITVKGLFALQYITAEQYDYIKNRMISAQKI